MSRYFRVGTADYVRETNKFMPDHFGNNTVCTDYLCSWSYAVEPRYMFFFCHLNCKVNQLYWIFSG